MLPHKTVWAQMALASLVPFNGPGVSSRGGQISTFIPSIQIFDFYPIGRLPHLYFFFQDRIEGQRLLPSIFCKVGVDGAMFFYTDSVKVDS